MSGRRTPSAAQQDALDMTDNGRILAGAGAGKTSTLVWICARDLTAGGIAPEELMVSSFTRVAAGEIRERLSSELRGSGISEAQMRAGTIDSICFDLVRERALDLGLSPSLGVALHEETLGISDRAYHDARASVGAGRMRDLHPFVEPTDDGGLHRLLRDLYERGASLAADMTFVSASPFAGPLRIDVEGLCDEFERLIPLLHTNVRARAYADLDALRRRQPEGVSGLSWGRLPDRIADQAARLRERIYGACRLLADERAFPARSALAELLGRYARGRMELARAEGAMGYTDIALVTAAGIADGLITRRFMRVYIDEAQDTNPLQMRIVSALCAPQGRIVLIGDANQSVYAFRNADPDQFTNLDPAEFPGRVFLADNYRSSPHLLAAISAVARRLSPQLSDDAAAMQARGTARPKDPPMSAVCVVSSDYPAPSVITEAHTAVALIEARRKELGVGRGDVAVLCRTRKAAGRWADALRAAGIPALVLQSGGVMETRECICAMDYLRLVCDPHRAEDMIAVLSGPIGALTHEAIQDIMAVSGDPLERLSRHSPDLALLLGAHHSMVDVLGVEELARRALEEIGYLDGWDRADASGTARRNIEGLLRRLGEFGHAGHDLDRALSLVAQDSNAGAQPAPPAPDLDAVRVMTIHGAKGEEYELVVLAGISAKEPRDDRPAHIDEDANLGLTVRARAGTSREPRPTWGDPLSVRIDEHRAAMEDAEQRRLVYVAMTRARRGLMVVLSGFVASSGQTSFPAGSLAGWLGPALLGPRGFPSLERPTRLDTLDEDTGAQVEVTRLAPDENERTDVADARARSVFPPPVRAACLGRAPAPLSFTALSAWRRCGLRRRLERDLGLGAPDMGLDHEGGATALGRRVHELLASLPFAEPVDAQLVAGRGRLGRMFTDAHDRAHAERVLAGYERLTELHGAIGAATDVRCELRFDIAAPFALGGRIDLVGHDGAGGALIVDWKTGADPQDRFQDDHELQQDLYALAAFVLFPDAPQVTTAWAYLGTDEPRVQWRRYERAEETALHAAVELGIHTTLNSPAEAAASEPQFFCRECPGLMRICPVSHAPTPTPQPIIDLD